MNVKSGITIVASSVFVPTKTRNRSFCLLGSYPKPREQPRDRGWLRVRFTTAVVPAAQEKTEPAPLCRAKKRQSCPCHHHRIAARLARDCLDNSQISSRRFCKSSMSAA